MGGGEGRERSGPDGERLLPAGCSADRTSALPGPPDPGKEKGIGLRVGRWWVAQWSAKQNFFPPVVRRREAACGAPFWSAGRADAGRVCACVRLRVAAEGRRREGGWVAEPQGGDG